MVKEVMALIWCILELARDLGNKDFQTISPSLRENYMKTVQTLLKYRWEQSTVSWKIMKKIYLLFEGWKKCNLYLKEKLKHCYISWPDPFIKKTSEGLSKCKQKINSYTVSPIKVWIIL